ncbi:hypothetical protein JCM8547_006522 [Rhodosporidiobolus lusitaniae]
MVKGDFTTTLKQTATSRATSNRFIAPSPSRRNLLRIEEWTPSARVKESSSPSSSRPLRALANLLVSFFPLSSPDLSPHLPPCSTASPTELLSHVVGLGAPIDYTPSFYRERRQFLRDVCRVSKRMRAVTQPMLVEVYVVKTKGDVKPLEEIDEEGCSRASKVKLLVLNGSPDLPAAGVSITDGLFTGFAAVVELRLVDAGDIDLDWLAPLTRAPIPFLPEESKLLTVVDQSSATSFPSSATTPALRAFGLTTASGEVDGLSPSLVQSASFLQRLDVFNLDMADEWPDEIYAISPSNTLLDCRTSDVSWRFETPAAVPPILRLFHLVRFNDVSTIHAKKPVSDIVRLLGPADAANSSSLRILILPCHIQPALLEAGDLDLLQAACAQRDVELVWEEQAVWDCQSANSPWFWRRVRRLKQEEAEKAKKQQLPTQHV